MKLTIISINNIMTLLSIKKQYNDILIMQFGYSICISYKIIAVRTYFFSYLILQKVILSILPVHFIKYLATVVYFNF